MCECVIYFTSYIPHHLQLHKIPLSVLSSTGVCDLATALVLSSGPQGRLPCPPGRLFHPPLDVNLRFRSPVILRTRQRGFHPARVSSTARVGRTLPLLLRHLPAAMLHCCGIPIFATAPSPHLFKHYHFYLFTIKRFL